MEQIKVFSPARFDLAGGTLDIYPIYLFFKNPFTLNSTLSKGITVKIKKVRGKSKIKNLNYGDEEFFPSHNPSLKIVSLLLENLGIENGVRIGFKSDFPQGSSLGVSSSLLVGLFYGLKRLFNLKMSLPKTVEFLKNVETTLINYPAGLQDYLAPLYGGTNAFYFGAKGYKREKIRLSKTISDSFLFVYTGKSHFSGAPNWELFKGFFDGNKSIKKGFEHIYQNSKKILQTIEKKDVKSLGKFLKEDFETRKNMLSSLVPNIPLFSQLDEIDFVYGYRLCGAAAGGTVVVVADREKKRKLRQQLEKLGYTVFDCVQKNIKVGEI